MEVLKENFTISYAATNEEPTKKELDYIFSLLPLQSEKCNFTNRKYNCDIPCRCDRDAIVFSYKIKSPYNRSEENEDEMRDLFVSMCSECGKWTACD